MQDCFYMVETFHGAKSNDSKDMNSQQNHNLVTTIKWSSFIYISCTVLHNFAGMFVLNWMEHNLSNQKKCCKHLLTTHGMVSNQESWLPLLTIESNQYYSPITAELVNPSRLTLVDHVLEKHFPPSPSWLVHNVKYTSSF